MQNLRELIWYTIPGALAITPLIFLDIFPLQNLNVGVTVGLLIFTSLPVGFLLNRIWYLWWNCKGGYAKKDRKNLQFILEQPELKKEEKNFNLAYLIWDYWIYRESKDRGIKEFSDKSRNYWTLYHSCGTCIIASIIASLIGIGLIVLKFHSFPCIQRPTCLLIGYVVLIWILEKSKQQVWKIINEWELMIAESNISNILSQDIIDAAKNTLEFEERGNTKKKTDK